MVETALPSPNLPRPDVAGVVRRIGGRGPAAVALSGGVDSSVVALLAREALGERATAVTLVGAAVSRSERDRAIRVAATVGIRHILVEVDPLREEAYASNPKDRCYHCRKIETRAIREWGSPHGIVQYLDGVHADDPGEDRPGIRAMDQAGFLHPLLEAGWGKSVVREIAHERGLPTWDEPSDACLASRITHGDRITAEGLARVADAEERVRSLGFRRVRVRVRGEGARVEVDGPEVSRLLAEPTASTVRSELERLGFREVTLDLVGYRSRPGA
ncbi:MAG: ATP-dependent sacrificial sulfur transferase LarE [Thermoplasmata archaeon]|nr:ATP-dependent sacrificial sulfur transferase LarE [Thermoplasmata archaeon]